MEPFVGIRRYRKLLTSAASITNRSHFLSRCIEEKVIPRCTPFHPKLSEHIFPEYIQLYLKNSIDELKHQHSSTLEQTKILRTQLYNENILSPGLETRIKRNIQDKNDSQAKLLDQKLSTLCRESKWKDIGRPELVTNISTHQLTDTELEALSLGLKFSTGLGKHKFTDLITRNYRHTDSDFTKGFIQGILLTATTSPNNETSIPKRYVRALENLKNKEDIYITQSDKGGGIVIMDRGTYHEKMFSLLQDERTYSKTSKKTIQLAVQSFIKSYKNIYKVA